MARRGRKERAPWYAAGLRFRCTACGVCCTGEPGHVWVDEAEIRAMAAAKGLAVRAFRRHYVRRVRGRLSLKEQPGGDCVMLEAGKCTVYDAKPTRCTTYPFWKPVLASPEDWEDAGRACEGIGQGDLYSAEEIEAIRAGDASILQAKHARPPEQPVVSAYRDGERIPDPSAEGEAASDAEDTPSERDPDWDAALAALERLYAELAAELPRYEFTCAASGDCCDFQAFGHRLYVTTLEAEAFFRGYAGRANEDPDACPAWGADRLCQARDARMLGCRTFFCGPWPVARPEEVHERYQARLLRLHEQHGIPYRYQDITAWAAERRPAADVPSP